MKKKILLAAALIGTGGCATARRGGVELGQTPEQVQSAFGLPDRHFRRQIPSGDVEAWGYMPFWPGFGLPAEPTGSRGSLTSDIPLEPIRDDEDMRVFFKQGKVIAVETRRR